MRHADEQLFTGYTTSFVHEQLQVVSTAVIQGLVIGMLSTLACYYLNGITLSTYGNQSKAGAIIITN